MEEQAEEGAVRPGDKINLKDLAGHGIGEKPIDLPEGVAGMRVYGTGLPMEGVYISKEEMEKGVVAVASGPSLSAYARNGSLW